MLARLQTFGNGQQGVSKLFETAGAQLVEFLLSANQHVRDLAICVLKEGMQQLCDEDGKALEGLLVWRIQAASLQDACDAPILAHALRTMKMSF